MDFCRIAALIVTLFFVAAPAVRAGEWPQFRGPSGQGTSEAKDVPTEWGPAKNVAWSTAVPGQGWSSPVLSNGKLYLTTAVTESKGRVSLGAMCIDASDGKVLWTAEPLKPDAMAGMHHSKNTPASSTPIVIEDRLYCHFGNLGTAALDLKGNVLWRQTGLKYMPVHGNGGSPILLEDRLIFSCDGAMNPFVACLDAKTGDVKWKTPRNTPSNRMFSFSTPLAIEIDGATQVVIPGSGLVAAYEPASGKEIWRVLYGDGYSVVPRPVYANGLIFCSSGFDSPVIYAINPEGAAGDATKSHVAWTQKKGAPATPSILAVGDEIYSISDGGIAVCCDAKTGKVHWTHRLSGGFSASPVYAGGHVYFQNEAGVGYVVKAGTTFELVAENDLGERALASYAVDDGTLYIRTDQHLWKIGGGK